MYADIYGRMEKKGWKMRKTSISRRVYLTFNMIVIALITVSCMVPILNVLATSFSSAAYINAGEVGLVPKGFTLAAYQFVLKDSRFWRSVLVTVERIVIGIPLNIGLSILIAYPLSKSELVFRGTENICDIFSDNNDFQRRHGAHLPSGIQSENDRYHLGSGAPRRGECIQYHSPYELLQKSAEGY